MAGKEELREENETLAKKLEKENAIYQQLIEPVKTRPNQPPKIWSREELNQLDKQLNIEYEIIKRMKEIREELDNQDSVETEIASIVEQLRARVRLSEERTFEKGKGSEGRTTTDITVLLGKQVLSWSSPLASKG